MASITLQYANLNKSIQVGDYVYYTSLVTNNAYNVNDSISETYGDTFIGKVTTLGTSGNNSTVVVNVPDTGIVIPSSSDYYYFVKDKSVNNSGALGYFAEVKMKNTSTAKAELFSIGSEIFESSK